MDIISAPLAGSKTYNRGCHFTAGKLTVIQSRDTKDVETYRVVEFTNALGRAFRLVKLAGSTDRETTNYEV
jgi:hypothetical protein